MKRFKARTAFIVFLCVLLLSGCSKRLYGGFCLLYQPVFLDYENDTAETIKQVEKNNVVYMRCQK